MFHQNFNLIFTILIVLTPTLGFTFNPLSSSTSCKNEEIIIRITGSNKITEAYLEGFKYYPDDLCRPKWINDTFIEFNFNISNFLRCGTTRIITKSTGAISYYNAVTVFTGYKEYKIFSSCKSNENNLEELENFLNSTLIRKKRSILPAGFREEENPALIAEKIGKAPEPILKMVVRQDGRVIGEELTVKPGSPLTLGVTLDSVSKDIYGIIVSKLEVTDTKAQSETLVHNACSVDPYLFENFLLDNGDLSAKFRAFKFPESNYVLFIATVNVCLTNCQGLTCSNGQNGYGRRKREISKQPDYIIQTSTILRLHFTA